MILIPEDRVRLVRSQYVCLFPNDHLIYAKHGGGEKLILAHKWRINKNTPVGEPTELYEATI